MPEARINTERYAELLEKLAKDEAFRQKFQSDAKATFAEYGMDVPDELIPEHIELSSPEELEARKTKLTATET